MHKRAVAPPLFTANSGKKPTTILFLGLARDCERTLPSFFSYMERLKSFGYSCSAIVGENGSRDRTRLLIQKARRVELLDTEQMNKGINRLARMAIGRQMLLEAARRHSASASYICVIDLDEAILSPPEPEAVAVAVRYLQSDETLFAVGATSRPVYYDLLSLRSPGHDYTDLYREITAAKKKPLSYFRFHQRHIYKNQSLISRATPIYCVSSFNGFCLYNRADYCLGNYRADDETLVCEHVKLNLSVALATGKRMLIAPEVVLQAPPAHIPVNFPRFWADRFRGKAVAKITAALREQRWEQNPGFGSSKLRSLIQFALPGSSRSDQAVP